MYNNGNSKLRNKLYQFSQRTIDYFENQQFSTEEDVLDSFSIVYNVYKWIFIISDCSGEKYLLTAARVNLSGNNGGGVSRQSTAAGKKREKM